MNIFLLILCIGVCLYIIDFLIKFVKKIIYYYSLLNEQEKEKDKINDDFENNNNFNKPLFSLLLFVTLSINIFAQDTIVHRSKFTAYVSFTYHQPMYVTYYLYKGGGELKRNDKFVSAKGTYTDKDYYKSGFDRGHLVNCEDFAYNQKYLDETFTYYNIIPQHASLNRGIWKTYENHVRKLSQTKSLFIVCGGYDYIKFGKLWVPAYNFKLVFDSNGNFLEGRIFTNYKYENSYIEVKSVKEFENISKLLLKY